MRFKTLNKTECTVLHKNFFQVPDLGINAERM